MEVKRDQPSSGSWKTYSRSVSCIEQPSSRKARASLPPLQPLFVGRPAIDQWPRPAMDDVGDWLNPPTPSATRPRTTALTPRENPTSDHHVREFELRREKLAFYSKECSRILDHVYLGSDAIAKNREELRRNGITHVLNCVGFSCPEYFKGELVYKTLWLKDSPAEDITSVLYDVYDYFEDVRERGGRVFVHCRQGVSRSTSLVIAYLMWKEGQSFDDAFRLVKRVRGITNPNVGFASQLLQCQRRVHALPPSPGSAVRMYRMSPHSPYDPLHLVPKMVPDPRPDKLDSRGAFIVHFPSRLYVWVGRSCSALMGDDALSAAAQVVRYEMVEGPVVAVGEGEEGFEFWDAFSYYMNGSVDDDVRNRDEGRKVSEYDLDFEIFQGAISGGVVPRFTAESETCLPIRESGWNRLRKKLAQGTMKELSNSS